MARKKKEKDEEPVKWFRVLCPVEIDNLDSAWEADRFPGLLCIFYSGADKKTRSLFVYRRAMWHSYLEAIDWWQFCQSLRTHDEEKRSRRRSKRR